MKTFRTASALRALAAAAVLTCASAQADVVHQVHMSFTNGGVFDGTLTFKDDYSSLQGVSGNLVGGTHVWGPGYGNVSFNWTWYAAFGDPSGDEDGNASTLEDYLMQGTDINDSDFTQIGISWFVPLSGQTPVLNLAAGRPYASLDNFHRIASYTFGPSTASTAVAEPASLALLGLGLGAVGLSMQRRRRRLNAV